MKRRECTSRDSTHGLFTFFNSVQEVETFHTFLLSYTELLWGGPRINVTIVILVSPRLTPSPPTSFEVCLTTPSDTTCFRC